jgi:putative phosphoribosyl transferase
LDPALLIVGGDDFPGLGMNQDAVSQLKGTKQLEIVPNATHLFEEQGTLEQAVKLAIRWFNRYLLT